MGVAPVNNFAATPFKLSSAKFSRGAQLKLLTSIAKAMQSPPF